MGWSAGHSVPHFGRSFARLGSTLSLYGMARLGSTLSCLDFASFGSTLSIRSLVRFGSTLSVYGIGRLGSTMSVLDFVHPAPESDAISKVLEAGPTVYDYV